MHPQCGVSSAHHLVQDDDAGVLGAELAAGECRERDIGAGQEERRTAGQTGRTLSPSGAGSSSMSPRPVDEPEESSRVCTTEAPSPRHRQRKRHRQNWFPVSRGAAARIRWLGGGEGVGKAERSGWGMDLALNQGLKRARLSTGRTRDAGSRVDGPEPGLDPVCDGVDFPCPPVLAGLGDVSGVFSRECLGTPRCDQATELPTYESAVRPASPTQKSASLIRAVPSSQLGPAWCPALANRETAERRAQIVVRLRCATERSGRARKESARGTCEEVENPLVGGRGDVLASGHSLASTYPVPIPSWVVDAGWAWSVVSGLHFKTSINDSRYPGLHRHACDHGQQVQVYRPDQLCPPEIRRSNKERCENPSKSTTNSREPAFADAPARSRRYANTLQRFISWVSEHPSRHQNSNFYYSKIPYSAKLDCYLLYHTSPKVSKLNPAAHRSRGLHAIDKSLELHKPESPLAVSELGKACLQRGFRRGASGPKRRNARIQKV
ncbi:unnamed protein product [Diplocarpon coronariae]